MQYLLPLLLAGSSLATTSYYEDEDILTCVSNTDVRPSSSVRCQINNYLFCFFHQLGDRLETAFSDCNQDLATRSNKNLLNRNNCESYEDIMTWVMDEYYGKFVSKLFYYLGL